MHFAAFTLIVPRLVVLSGRTMLEESYNDLIKKERIEDVHFDNEQLNDHFDSAVKRETAPAPDKTKN